MLCLSTLPCLADGLSSAQAKLHLKMAHRSLRILPCEGSKTIMESLFKTVTFLISIIGQSIKEADLNHSTELNRPKLVNYSGTVRILNMGTPNQLSKLNFSSLLQWFTNRRDVISLTSLETKPLRSVLKSLIGGKIAEKAKVLGNAKNIGDHRSSSKIKSRELKSGISSLNSVCLNKISNKISIGRSYSTQNVMSKDITRPEYLSLQLSNPLEIREEVELKQKELVKLAERHGLFDSRVQQAQILMARSLLFRTHAANIMANKPGSQTPGVDNELMIRDDIMLSKDELSQFMRDMIYHPKKYKPKPIKRVWIPKPGKSENRPLGIPTIKDRAMQTLINLVLLPLVEMNSDSESYGFRPYRDCKMAIAAVRMQLRTLSFETQQKSMALRFGKPGLGAYTQQNEDKWILDADIKGFFDNINHDWLLNKLFLHPTLKEFVRLWLKAKILDAGMYTNPITGTPQGGIISPTLANFTLNGLEKAVLESIHPITRSKVRRLTIKNNGRTVKAVSLGVSIVRYADDFIVLAKSKNILVKYIRPAIDNFLAERGLFLSPQKTKMFTLKEENTQLDFLGYTFKYSKRWSAKRNIFYEKGYVGGIALYPNKEKVRNFIRKLSQIFSNSNNLSAVELITKLNPIIRG